MIADVTILYEALDDQQLIVLQEDLDQDGLLNQDMPVVYTHSQVVVTEGTSYSFVFQVAGYYFGYIDTRDVPDPDTSIRNPAKFRHPALCGIRVKFAGYLTDSTSF